MTNRILLIVTVIVLVLLILSGSLIYLIVSASASNRPVVLAGQETSAVTEDTSATKLPFAPTSTGILSPDEPSISTNSETEQSSQAVGTIPSIQAGSTYTNPSNFPPLIVQCNQTGSYTLSLIVEDSNTYEPPFGAELIRLTGIDFDNSQVVLIPLSIYIELPTSSLNETYGISKLTLGTVYHTVYQRSTNLDQRQSDASRILNQVIKDNFKIAPNHYISLNQTFIRQFTKFAGVFEVDNPQEFTSLQAKYPIGQVKITSDNVWDYLVYTKDVGDEFSRLERQDILLGALFDAVHTNHSVDELQQWLQNHQAELTTDMDASQLASTFCALSFSNEGSLRYAPIPAEYFTANSTTLTITNPDPVIDFIDQQLSSIH